MSTPALLEALESARLRIEELEIEKSHALKRFEEMTGRIHRLAAEVKALKAALAVLESK